MKVRKSINISAKLIPFNSSGSPLTDAAAILQQDRFYVNAKNRLDKYDQADNYFTNKSLRATYGQYWRDIMFPRAKRKTLNKTS